MRRVLSLLALAAALMLMAVPALAQKEKSKDADANVRSVQGVVTDASGAALSGAVVHLENKKTQQIRSYITKEDGAYVFHGLSTNVDFDLKAEYQGASSPVRTLSVFDSRRKATIDLKVKK